MVKENEFGWRQNSVSKVIDGNLIKKILDIFRNTKLKFKCKKNQRKMISNRKYTDCTSIICI